MNCFDVIGPVMVGPSSSHTAGAVRLGQIASILLAEKPLLATIGLHGSFARTGSGHGTDKAILAGLLGLSPDDERIRQSRQLAQAAGLNYTFTLVQLDRAHPNTAVIDLRGISGRTVNMRGASTGAANALAAAEMALAGIGSAIPVDEVIAAMKQVGEQMPAAHKETAEGGLAVTATGRALAARLKKRVCSDRHNTSHTARLWHILMPCFPLSGQTARKQKLQV